MYLKCINFNLCVPNSQNKDKFWRNFKNYHTKADILCSNAPPVIVIMSAKFEYMYYRDQRQMYSIVRKCWVSGYYLYYVRFCDRCHATCWAVCNSSALRHGQNKRQFDGKFPFNHQAPLLQQSRPNGARMLITRGGFCISVSLSEHVSITNTMMYKWCRYANITIWWKIKLDNDFFSKLFYIARM